MATQAEIQSLFQSTLLSDEEIYWFGEPKHNYWRLRRRDLAFLLLSTVILLPIILVISVLLMGGYLLLTAGNWIYLISPVILWGVLMLRFVVSWIVRSQVDDLQELSSSFLDKPSSWWKKTYYLVTSHRVLIFEQGQIRDYWFTILDEPILRKAKNGIASIQLYSSQYAAKEKDFPVLDAIQNLAESEADDVYNILHQAREEALEKRKNSS